MAFPTNKAHRRNRRKLQTGQGPFPAAATVTVAPSTNSMVLTFNRPVNLNGTIGCTVAGRALVSQTQNSAQQITVLFDGTVATKAWTVPANSPALSTYQGGPVSGASGTFP
jgi:hypothetical protein